MRHEKNIHEKQAAPAMASTSARPSSSDRPNPSPAITRSRGRDKQKTSHSEWRRVPIFDFENDPKARRLRDKAMAEHAKYLERIAGDKKKEMQARRIALEGRRQTLIEKNLLAAENERIRAEQAREKNERSERALNKLIESRKRRR